jgi:ParB family chromosome partitioning protein
LDREGKFEVEYWVRPGDKKKGAAKAKAAQAAPAGPAKISNSLDHRLEATLMRATQDALKASANAGSGLEHILAAVVAAQLQPDRGEGYTPSAIRSAMKTIRERLPAKLLNDAVAKRFDAKDYFSSVPKPFVIKALKEAGFEDEAKKLDAGTKAAAWKRAVQIVPKTGWLPTEVRTPHYAGPGAAKKKAAR